MRIDLDDADRFCRYAQPVGFNQRFDRIGQFAKAVDQFFLQMVDALLRFSVGQTLVN